MWNKKFLLPLSQIQSFRNSQHTDSQQHVVTYFGRLATAWFTTVYYISTHAFEDRFNSVINAFFSTNHKCESTILGSDDTWVNIQIEYLSLGVIGVSLKIKTCHGMFCSDFWHVCVCPSQLLPNVLLYYAQLQMDTFWPKWKGRKVGN